MGLFDKFRRRRESHVPEPEPETIYPDVPDRVAISAYSQWWRYVVNGGSRFRLDLDDHFHGYQFGEPWVHARLVEADTGGETFSQIAEILYRRGLGVILCREGWSVTQTQNIDVLFVGYGEVVDFLLSGELAVQENGTRGWGWPDDLTGLQRTDPGTDVLLPYQRFFLDKALRTRGVAEPRVALITDHNDMRHLMFNLYASLGDQEQAMQMSGLVNYYLPKYYYQVVSEHDGDRAVFPLLPDGPDNGEAVQRAEAQRQNGPAPAAAIREEAAETTEASEKRAVEERWRQVARSPSARFRFDIDVFVHDQDGVPYTLVHVAPDDAPDASSFRAVALCLSDRGSGALLCDKGWQVEGNRNRLPVSQGELVSFLMTGRLEWRARGSGGWGVEEDWGTGTYTEPDPLLLPLQCRRTILQFLGEVGVTEPQIALYTSRSGKLSLHFSGWGDVLTGDDGMQQVRRMSRVLNLLLPPHYIGVMDEPNLSASTRRQRWPLMPSGAYEGYTEAAP